MVLPDMGRQDELGDMDREDIAAWLGRNVLSAEAAAPIMGLSHRNSVYTYKTRHDDFPPPILRHGKCQMWLRADIEAWVEGRRISPVADDASASAGESS